MKIGAWLNMPETVAEGKPERKLNKTHALYGFIGKTNYDEEFLRELDVDFKKAERFRALADILHLAHSCLDEEYLPSNLTYVSVIV